MKGKKKAAEKYDDAVAGGHTAILAERQTEQKETMTIKLGNLPPE